MGGGGDRGTSPSPTSLETSVQASRRKLHGRRKQSANSIEHQKAKKRDNGASHFDFKNPPKSVTWVLDAENDKWEPFVGNKHVGEEIKNSWKEPFDSINGAK
ncbi:hypothetical protein Dsin_006233 [Dipteronia sinensis]|uniref:Uncharacterized protein n=1 Tax=Dipteronia sinensis TaxID=43782 RepID=A0AAE0EFF8_9ROSI|nr:hypothetical protein Dsin_006233 [Dipteronia sinensis]